LIPNFDFDAYNHDQVAETEVSEVSEISEVEDVVARVPVQAPTLAINASVSGNGAGSAADANEEVDKW
jgi:hypothetical protein